MWAQLAEAVPSLLSPRHAGRREGAGGTHHEAAAGGEAGRVAGLVSSQGSADEGPRREHHAAGEISGGRQEVGGLRAAQSCESLKGPLL